jgi:hypothetical protein
MIYSDYDFKFAKTILEQHFADHLREIEDAVHELSSPLGRNVTPTAAKVLEQLLVERNWQSQQAVTTQESRLKFDLLKGKVAVEIQTADPSDCFNDYLKFLLAYNLELIEVGVEIVYHDSVKGNNIPRLSKVRRDLELYRRVLPCPIWVVGLRQA